MPSKDRTAVKLPRLRESLKDAKTLLIVMQDHPDPDAIGAAAALRFLANQIFGLSCSLVHGGSVGRAENRALVRYLDLNLRPVSEVDGLRFDAVAMVDTQPVTGNNSLPPTVPVQMVFDHHPMLRNTRQVPFTDIRRDYGACSTILYEYLAALKLQPDVPLATALCCGIRSDTQDLGRESTNADIAAYVALYPLANKRVLGRIQLEPEPIEYYRTLSLALAHATVYGRCVVSDLTEVDWPEAVAEVADLLVRYEAVNSALCYGVYRETLHLSLRTRDSDADAGRVMRRIVSRLGSGGGHDAMAGGQVPLQHLPALDRKRVMLVILRRFLRSVHVRKTEGRPLLAKD